MRTEQTNVLKHVAAVLEFIPSWSQKMDHLTQVVIVSGEKPTVSCDVLRAELAGDWHPSQQLAESELPTTTVPENKH